MLILQHRFKKRGGGGGFFGAVKEGGSIFLNVCSGGEEKDVGLGER